MKKSLISKVVLAIVLVSASTQAFSMGYKEINEFFEGRKTIKKAFVITSGLLATVGVAATLGFIQAKIDELRLDMRYFETAFNPVINIMAGLVAGSIAGYATHKIPALSVYGLFSAGAAGLAFFATNYGNIAGKLK